MRPIRTSNVKNAVRMMSHRDEPHVAAFGSGGNPLIQPYVPQSAGKLLDLLGVSARGFTDLPKRLVSGVALPGPQPIFPRYVEEGDAPAKS